MKKGQIIRKKRYAQFHLYIDENILKRLKALAEGEGRKIAELVREGMADLLERRECKINKGKGGK